MVIRLIPYLSICLIMVIRWLSDGYPMVTRSNKNLSTPMSYKQNSTIINHRVHASRALQSIVCILVNCLPSAKLSPPTLLEKAPPQRQSQTIHVSEIYQNLLDYMLSYNTCESYVHLYFQIVIHFNIGNW